MKKISFKKKNGIYYTNTLLAKKMISLLDVNYQKNFKLIELAIGEGHIMAHIIQEFLNSNKHRSENYIINFLENNFYGFDIRKDAIILCKKKLDRIVSNFFQRTVNVDWKIYCVDILKYNIKLNEFDYVISNPPYVSKVNMDTNAIKFLKSNSQFCAKYNS